MILVVREYGQDCPNQIPEITLAFEDDGPLGRGMGALRPKNDFQQFKQF